MCSGNPELLFANTLLTEKEMNKDKIIYFMVYFVT